MTDDSIGQLPDAHEDEIDLKELFSVLWQRRISIVLITVLGAIISVGYALYLPNIYESEARLAPKAEGSQLDALSGQLGGLAGLAGINIGGGEANKTLIALETLKSRGFFAEYIYDETVIALMASRGWDSKSGELVIDEGIFDVTSKDWLGKGKPSIQEAYLVYRGHFSIVEDQIGLVSIKVKHYSPVIARDLVNLMLQSIEASAKERDVSEAEKSIAFLKRESETTTLISLKEVFANLIEEQTKKVVLADASEDYLFQVIEPPVVPERKVEPRRSFICILGTLLAGILSVLYVLVRFYGFEKKGTGI